MNVFCGSKPYEITHRCVIITTITTITTNPTEWMNFVFANTDLIACSFLETAKNTTKWIIHTVWKWNRKKRNGRHSNERTLTKTMANHEIWIVNLCIAGLPLEKWMVPFYLNIYITTTRTTLLVKRSKARALVDRSILWNKRV